MNNTSKYQMVFYISLLLIAMIVSTLIFWPFLVILSLSAVLAIMLAPVQRKIQSYVKWPGVASAISILLLILLVGSPLWFLGNQIVTEAQGLYSRLSAPAQVIAEDGTVQSNPGSWSLTADAATVRVESIVQRFVPEFKLDTRQYLAGFSSWVVARLGGVFSGTLDLGLKTFLFLIALFYFLRDGSSFKKNLKLLSPFEDSKNAKIESAITNSVRSVLFGSIVVAVVQGILSTLGFMIFGVPNAVLWGTVAGLAALIPGLGTGIVSAPIIIYLVFYGTGLGGFAWLGQLIWSGVFVGLVDNLLAPFVINKGINIHPMLILFSILGGLQFFGPEGFILGPLVISILFALMRLYDEQKANA
ncbi:MAG TPA: AI-2E family transporter [Candidatus Paceibacterota bacterium]